MSADPELRRDHGRGRRPRGADLELWRAWLRRHGLDPGDVLMDFLERRPERRQLVYRTPARRCPGCGTPRLHVEQLEGVPLPFPAPAG